MCSKKENIMTKKCIGCGLELQTENKKEPGYINEKVISKASYCERCFKVINYGEASVVYKDVDINNFLDNISKSNKPVLYLLDLTCISPKTMEPLKNITNDIFIVLTKKDLLPKSVKDKKLIEYIKKHIPNAKDITVISSTKMWSVKELYNKLKNKVKEIYVIGFTNSGKSTLINSMLKMKGKTPFITTSWVPNTTEEAIKISLDENLTLIDTLGFINDKSIVNFINIQDYKNLLPKKEIKPKVYHLKKGFMILIENLIRIENNTDKIINIVFYLKNELKYQKMKSDTRNDLKIYPKQSVSFTKNEDLVIEGLGFIKFASDGELTIYSISDKIITIRDQMI